MVKCSTTFVVIVYDHTTNQLLSKKSSHREHAICYAEADNQVNRGLVSIPAVIDYIYSKYKTSTFSRILYCIPSQIKHSELLPSETGFESNRGPKTGKTRLKTT